jgi:hypothetical protein
VVVLALENLIKPDTEASLQSSRNLRKLELGVEKVVDPGAVDTRALDATNIGERKRGEHCPEGVKSGVNKSGKNEGCIGLFRES